MATAAKRQATSLRRQVKKLFYEFDETGDGAIDPGELKSFATRLGHTWTKDQLGVARRILGASYDKTGEGNPIRLDDLLGFFSKASHLDDAIRSVSSQLNDDSSDYESSEMDDGEEDTPEVRLLSSYVHTQGAWSANAAFAHSRPQTRLSLTRAPKRGVRSLAPPNTFIAHSRPQTRYRSLAPPLPHSPHSLSTHLVGAPPLFTRPPSPCSLAPLAASRQARARRARRPPLAGRADARARGGVDERRGGARR